MEVQQYCLLWQQWACLPSSDWAAWAQAILSAFAIAYASRMATKQAEAQHKTAMKQVHEQHALDRLGEEAKQRAHRIAVAEALSKRVAHAIGVINSIRQAVKEAAKESSRLSAHNRMLFRESLLDIERDIARVSIFELPVPQMVEEFVFLKTAIKQVLFNFDSLLQENSNYDEQLVKQFDPPMEYAVRYLADFHDSLENHKQ